MYKPVVKLSSIGKSVASDIANVRYIGRGDYVVYDEAGNVIPKKKLADAVRKRSVGDRRSKKSSYRVIVSLAAATPEDADAAFAELQQELAVRLGHKRFLLARHPDHGKQHVHILSFHLPKYELSRLDGIFRLRNDLAARFDASGVKFIPEPRSGLAENTTQCEAHMREDGRAAQIWKEPFREAIRRALDEARNYDDWKKLLADVGYIVTERGQNITVIDNEQRRIRIGKLFRQLRSRQDVETYLAKQKKRRDDMAEREEREEQNRKDQAASAALGVARSGVSAVASVAGAAASEDPAKVALVAVGAGLQMGLQILTATALAFGDRRSGNERRTELYENESPDLSSGFDRRGFETDAGGGWTKNRPEPHPDPAAREEALKSEVTRLEDQKDQAAQEAAEQMDALEQTHNTRLLEQAKRLYDAVEKSGMSLEELQTHGLKTGTGLGLPPLAPGNRPS